MRRRSLATSVVVTISLVELAGIGGCDGADKPKPVAQAKKSDGKTRDAKTRDAKTPDAKTPDTKTPDTKAPDTKTPDAKAPAGETGAAPPTDPHAVPDHVHSNPPPPDKPASAKPANPMEPDPFPYPSNKLERDGTTTMLQADGTCMRVKENKCKPGAHCNPPKPKKIKCPKELQLPRKKGKAEVYEAANHTCWQRGVADCAGSDDCDPVPSTRVVCPAKLGKK